MKPRLLVVTSVHQSDDPRIRERLIRTLLQDFDVSYATRTPGPSDRDGIEWLPLEGDRRTRRKAVGRLLLEDPYEVAVIHDPELLPGAIRAAKKGRRIVFDLHENLPAQLSTRGSIPSPLRPTVSKLAARYLRFAEARVEVTLAEENYRELFQRQHVVFPNYPRYSGFPDPSHDPAGPIVYVGDVTEIRGAITLVEAVASLDVRRDVVFVGRCSDTLEARLLSLAKSSGVSVTLQGWLPHPEAMQVAAGASVGLSPLHDAPNYRDSLPTKVLEYLAVGTPVVASDLPGTRRVIAGLSATELVAPGSSAALAEGLERILNAPNIDQQARDAARIVRERFVWPDAEVREFYGSLLP